VIGAGALRGALRPSALKIALLGVAFLALFYNVFWFQHLFSWGNPDWSHAYIVPLISGWVIWQRREAIREAGVERFWPGLIPLLVGIACYFYFWLGYTNHMFRGFAMALSLFGLVGLLMGPRVLSLTTFPIAYLGFGVTISEMVMNQLTFQLQIIATRGSWLLLNMLGMATERAGNTLTILTDDGREIPLNVAEACSGMRMLVAFVALGAAVAFIACRHWWQRIALLLAAAPIAVLVNILRVAFLGWASVWDQELSRGDAHTLIGVLWLVPAFLMFMGVVWSLKKIVNEPSDGFLAGAKA